MYLYKCICEYVPSSQPGSPISWRTSRAVAAIRQPASEQTNKKKRAQCTERKIQHRTNSRQPNQARQATNQPTDRPSTTTTIICSNNNEQSRELWLLRIRITQRTPVCRIHTKYSRRSGDKNKVPNKQEH